MACGKDLMYPAAARPLLRHGLMILSDWGGVKVVAGKT